MKFDNLREYREALYQEVEIQSRGDLARAIELQRDIALERAASRFDQRETAIKGGFGVRTLVSPSPYTADIDILIDKPEWHGLSKDDIYRRCGQYVIDSLNTSSPDQLRFLPTIVAPIEDSRRVELVAKIYMQVSLGNDRLSTVEVDAGIKPQGMPVETASGRDVLAFAEIENPTIMIAAREFLAADKISLFLETGIDRPRDLVHAALLLEEGKYDADVLASWLEKLAKRRGVESKLASALSQPSPMDLALIDRMVCQKYGLAINAKACYTRVNGLLERLYGRERLSGSSDRSSVDLLPDTEPGTNEIVSKQRKTQVKEITAKDARGKLQKYTNKSRIEDLILLKKKSERGERRLKDEDKKALDAWIAARLKDNSSPAKDKRRGVVASETGKIARLFWFRPFGMQRKRCTP